MKRLKWIVAATLLTSCAPALAQPAAPRAQPNAARSVNRIRGRRCAVQTMPSNTSGGGTQTNRNTVQRPNAVALGTNSGYAQTNPGDTQSGTATGNGSSSTGSSGYVDPYHPTVVVLQAGNQAGSYPQSGASAWTNGGTTLTSSGNATAGTGPSSYIVPGVVNPHPLRIAIQQHAVRPSIPVQEDETSLYCTVGTVLSLAGALTGDSMLAPTFQVDRHTVASDTIALAQRQYVFYWEATEPGTYFLRVMYAPDEGDAPAALKSVQVTVSYDAPVSLGVPHADGDTSARLLVTRSTVPGFRAVRSEAVIDDVTYALPETRTEIDIAASKTPSGGHDCSVVSYAADGIRFVSMPATTVSQHDSAP